MRVVPFLWRVLWVIFIKNLFSMGLLGIFQFLLTITLYILYICRVTHFNKKQRSAQQLAQL